MEDVPLFPLVLGAILVACVGYETRRRRDRLRRIFNVFDKQESKVAEALETMVRNGELKPYMAGGSA
ncbi:MAG: hypothetical protein ACLQIB_28680 [Isosphaeraceae bacterium]